MLYLKIGPHPPEADPDGAVRTDLLRYAWPEVGGCTDTFEVAMHAPEKLLDLADRIFREAGKVDVEVVTWSDLFVLRVRRLIAEAEGDLSGRVRLLFKGEIVPIDRYGSIRPWPRGLFVQRDEQVYGILRAAEDKYHRELR